MESKSKEILRAQWQARQGKWRIVKKTYTGSGGWKLLEGAEPYDTGAICQTAIKSLVNEFPEKYKEE
jgi:hypothetical protein